MRGVRSGTQRSNVENILVGNCWYTYNSLNGINIKKIRKPRFSDSSQLCLNFNSLESLFEVADDVSN